MERKLQIITNESNFYNQIHGYIVKNLGDMSFFVVHYCNTKTLIHIQIYKFFEFLL